nr:hypothetical protein [Tanacetum cinerariifolium]
QTEYKVEDVDEGVWTPSNNEFTDKEKLYDEETMDDEEDDEVLKELYEDVNVNLEKGDDEMTYANQRGDGVDTRSKVPDRQVQKTSGTAEGTGTIPGVPDVPLYESESDKEY